MNRIPTEILLQIFGNLSYGDLHLRIPLVSRHFRSLLQRTSPGSCTQIDRVLLRDAPKTSSTAAAAALENVEYEVNPIIDDVIYGYATFESDLTVNGSRNEWGELVSQGFPLSDHPVAEENAFIPTVKRAVYHHPWLGLDNDYIEIAGTGSNGGSVTVLDLMIGAVEIARRCKLAAPAAVYEIVGAIWEGIGRVEVVDGVLHAHDRIQRQDFSR